MLFWHWITFFNDIQSIRANDYIGGYLDEISKI
jgi:hypothetical protein